MMFDNYFKYNFIKDIFIKSCLNISNISQAEILAKTLDSNPYNINIIFETSYLKSIFFNKVKIYHPDIKIINCDSSKNRLLNEIEEYSNELIIFDKINYCDDFDIFNKINKMNRILIC